MRRIIYSLVLSVVAITMAACQRDKTGGEGGEQGGMPQVSISPIVSNSLTPQGVASRLAPQQGDKVAAFEAGDMVGLFTYDEKGLKFAHSNIKYTADANVKFAPDAPIYYASYNYHQIYAYYPYNASVTDATVLPLVIPVDQTKIEDYAKADFLSDTLQKVHPQQVSPKAPELKMEFKHNMTSVIVKIKNGDNSPMIELPAVKFVNIYTKAQFNLLTQKVSTYSTTLPKKNGRIVDSIILRRAPHGDDAATNTVCYQGIVLPQTLVYGQSLVFIEFGAGEDSRVFQYVPAVNGPDLPRGLVKGAEHIFNLTIAGTELKVDGGEIVPWGTGVSVKDTIGSGGVMLAKTIFELQTESGETEDAVATVKSAELTIDGIKRSAQVTYVVGVGGAKSRLVCVFNQGTDWGYFLQGFVLKDSAGTAVLSNSAIATDPLRMKGNYIALNFDTPIATIKTVNGDVVK